MLSDKQFLDKDCCLFRMKASTETKEKTKTAATKDNHNDIAIDVHDPREVKKIII